MDSELEQQLLQLAGHHGKMEPRRLKPPSRRVLQASPVSAGPLSDAAPHSGAEQQPWRQQPWQQGQTLSALHELTSLQIRKGPRSPARKRQAAAPAGLPRPGDARAKRAAGALPLAADTGSPVAVPATLVAGQALLPVMAPLVLGDDDEDLLRIAELEDIEFALPSGRAGTGLGHQKSIAELAMQEGKGLFSSELHAAAAQLGGGADVGPGGRGRGKPDVVGARARQQAEAVPEVGNAATGCWDNATCIQCMLQQYCWLSSGTPAQAAASDGPAIPAPACSRPAALTC
jgi:hypothetical protein